MAGIRKIPQIAAGPSRHVYDVIVLGSQLGGALAAALLAKRGHRILHVEHDGTGPGYEHEGYLLPYCPFVAPPLKSLPAAEEALGELGLTTAVSRLLKAHQPPLQLVLEKQRIDLHLDPGRRKAELARELGARAAEAEAAISQAIAFHEKSDAFFQGAPDLPPDGLLETLGVSAAIRRQPDLLEGPSARGEDDPKTASPEGLLEHLASFVTYSHSPQTPIARLRALSQALKGPSRYPGGREALRELLWRKLVDLGGDALGRDGTESFVAEHLSFENDRLVGVKVIQSETVYQSRAVIGATDAGALGRLVEEKKRHRKLIAQLQLSEVRRFLFTVNWMLPAQAIPMGMGDLVLFWPEREPSPLLIQVYPARKVGAKADDENLRIVCAATSVAASARELGEAHYRELQGRLSQSLEELMPFSTSKRLVASSPYLDAVGVRGSRLLPHPLFAVDVDRRLGVEGLSQRTAVKNLFLANREVLPGLGLEGELLAGIRAARLVEGVLPKREVLKR